MGGASRGASAQAGWGDRGPTSELEPQGKLPRSANTAFSPACQPPGKRKKKKKKQQRTNLETISRPASTRRIQHETCLVIALRFGATLGTSSKLTALRSRFKKAAPSKQNDNLRQTQVHHSEGVPPQTSIRGPGGFPPRLPLEHHPNNTWLPASEALWCSSHKNGKAMATSLASHFRKSSDVRWLGQWKFWFLWSHGKQPNLHTTNLTTNHRRVVRESQCVS